MLNAIQDANPALREAIAGVIFFGYTRNGVTGGSIPGFPREKVRTFCNLDDGVCGLAGPVVTPGHLTYSLNGDIGRATNFLVQRINAAGGGAAGGAAGGVAGGLGAGGLGAGRFGFGQ